MPCGQRCSKLLLWMGLSQCFHSIVPLKVPAPKLDKGFVIGGYFGTRTLECWKAMPSGQRCSKLLLWMDFSLCFLFDCPLESNASQTWQGVCYRWIFCYGDFWVLVGNAKGQRCSKLLLLMGFSLCFHFYCPLESTASQTWQGICHREVFWYGDFWVLVGNAKWPKMLQTFALDGFQWLFSLWF